VDVRFSEYRYWDIDSDSHKVKLMATNGLGTYVMDAPIYGAASLRENRKNFQEYVEKCLIDGIPPHEAELE